MKKISVISIILLVCTILFGACKKKECQGLVHDNPPMLSDTGYNTCEAIYYNYYMYQGTGEGSEMVSQMVHSRIKACGYIHTYADWDRSYYSLADTPQHSDEHPEVELEIGYLLPLDTIEIDGTKKYYVTGALDFAQHPYHGNDFGPCMTFYPTFMYIDSCYHK